METTKADQVFLEPLKRMYLVLQARQLYMENCKRPRFDLELFTDTIDYKFSGKYLRLFFKNKEIAEVTHSNGMLHIKIWVEITEKVEEPKNRLSLTYKARRMYMENCKRPKFDLELYDDTIDYKVSEKYIRLFFKNKGIAIVTHSNGILHMKMWEEIIEKLDVSVAERIYRLYGK